MDATLIAASPSTKNKAAQRDPTMSQSKKGKQWYFGMKVHVGVDARSGLVHTAGVTTGRVHDAKVMDNLIREDDRAVFGDKGYVNEKKKQRARAAGVYWGVKDQRKPGRQLSSSQNTFVMWTTCYYGTKCHDRKTVLNCMNACCHYQLPNISNEVNIKGHS